MVGLLCIHPLGRELAPGFDHLFGPASTRDGIPAVPERRAA